jgi:hypothetical protein
MKRNTFSCAALCALLSLAAGAGAQNATVSYIEGDPDLRNGSGAVTPLDYDSKLRTGDSVLTGKAEQVELAQGADTTIRIRSNTVFTIREVDTGAGKEQVLTTAVGAVSMRFGKLAGREPRVGTVGTVAGIRGTELTVYASPDGSALFVVESGLVSVGAAGATVELAKDEAVEVSAAGVPGEKFSVIGREKDFSAWEEKKAQELLADPVAALNDARIMLSTFRSGLDEWTAKYRDAKSLSDAAVEKMNSIADKAEQAKFRDEQWAPLALQTGNAVLNYRYYALSAFSLRRYVLGPLYVQMRTRNMAAETPEYRAFREAYNLLLAEYKQTFNPYLGAVDY